MTDYFSERFSALYIRGAVLFAVVVGIAEILLAVRGSELVSKWAIVEGILVLALAFGVWKRSFVSAIALLALKTVGAIVWSYQSGQAPKSNVLIQLVFYGLAAAAIHLGRANRQLSTPEAQPSVADGKAK